MVNTRLVLLYIGIINKAMTLRCKHLFDNCLHAGLNLNRLFDGKAGIYIRELAPCSDCSTCNLHLRLFPKTDVENICIVNALLFHTKVKNDIKIL